MFLVAIGSKQVKTGQNWSKPVKTDQSRHFLARYGNSGIATATKHGGIVGDFGATLSSTVAGSEWESGWVAGAARPWAAS